LNVLIQWQPKILKTASIIMTGIQFLMIRWLG